MEADNLQGVVFIVLKWTIIKNWFHQWSCFYAARGSRACLISDGLPHALICWGRSGERSQSVDFWIWSGDSFCLLCETREMFFEDWSVLPGRASSAELVNPRLSSNLRLMMGWTCAPWHKNCERQTWKHRLYAVEPSFKTCSKWEGTLGDAQQVQN